MTASIRAAISTSITYIQQLLLATDGIEVRGNRMIPKRLSSAVIEPVEIGNRRSLVPTGKLGQLALPIELIDGLPPRVRVALGLKLLARTPELLHRIHHHQVLTQRLRLGIERLKAALHLIDFGSTNTGQLFKDCVVRLCSPL